MTQFRYPANFWRLCLSSFLFFSSFTMLLPELPDYLSAMGGKDYIGMIIFLFTLTAGLSRPFSGKLADRWGRIPVMVVGAIVSGISALIYPLTTGVVSFLMVRLVHGFSTGFKPTGTSAYVADLVPVSKRGEALGISSFFGGIGTSMGPFMGSSIYLEWGINPLFYTSSCFAIGSVIILLGMGETLVKPEKFHWGLLKINSDEIIERRVLFPALIMLLTYNCFGVVLTLTPDFSSALGMVNKGIFFSVFTGSSLLVRIIGGRISDRFGRVIVLKISSMITGISLLLIGTANSVTQFMIGGFIFGIGYGLNSPTLFAWTIDLTPTENRGKGVSTLYIALEIAIGFGAFFSGFAYGGDLNRLPLIFGCSSFLTFVAFLLLFKAKSVNLTHLEK